MDYVPLGTTGVRISRIILGCGNFGGIGSAPAFFGQGENDDEAAAIMDAALDLGINVFDTADAYGGGRSESAIGRWLAGKGSAVRDQVLLSSKAFNPVGDGPNDHGLSRRHLKRQVERSLQRLGASHLDLFLTHEPDADTPLDETLGALDDLVRAGTIHYIGASNVPAWQLVHSLWLSERERRRPLRLGAELLQPARTRARGRAVPRTRRVRARLHAVLAARGRLADREVPSRRNGPVRARA